MNLLERLQRPMDFFLKAGALLSGAGMLGVVFLQVFARAFLPQTPHWTEEAARITFVYTASFAAGLAVKNKTYVRVDTLINRFPAKVRTILEVFVSLAVAGFMGLSGWLSLTMVRLGAMQSSPSLRIPMSIFFASMLVMFFFTGLYSLLEAVRGLASLAEKEA